jgi:hypothetical protein
MHSAVRRVLTTGIRVVCLAATLAPVVLAAPPRRTDVVVYGGTAAGVIAAVATAGEGKSVVLLEPDRHVGGMVSGGLGATDHGNRAAIGGLSREFFRRVKAHYVLKSGEASPQVRDCSDGFRFEPHVAELVFHQMLAEARVEVVHGARLARVVRDGPRIQAIETLDGSTFAAAIFIDASYEGDLMARAGVRYETGREGRDRYGESIAGVQAQSAAHQWPGPVAARDEQGRPLPGVQAEAPGQPGSGDAKTQAYNYRVCMTERPEIRVPFPKPEGYDPARYELLARYLERYPNLRVGQLMHPARIPNGKTDTNNNGPFSTDHIGGNWSFPEAGLEERERIRRDHVAYVQGFLYFLANDPRVPRPLHDEMARWGLARDEFIDTDHWPHQLYIRECRRMLGAYVMTQSDIFDHRTKTDSVGLGSYTTDSHHVQRVARADGSALNEGDFQVPVRPYAIPYRSLIPKANEGVNLLVPVCMSASHVAYGTIRMEPVYMILGHACGVAASLAVEGSLRVQDVPADRLVAKLAAAGSILSPEGLPEPTRPASAQGIDPASLAGVVVDDAAAERVGDWVESTSTTPYVGKGYVHDGGRADPSMRVRFVARLPRSGRHEVRLFAPALANRATHVAVIIGTADGERTMTVDERKSRPGDGPIVLGRFRFASGEPAWVEVRSGSTVADGHVIADAVQFVEVP